MNLKTMLFAPTALAATLWLILWASIAFVHWSVDLDTKVLRIVTATFWVMVQARAVAFYIKFLIGKNHDLATN